MATKQGKMEAYSVTLEWTTTNYVQVAVKARSVEEALEKAATDADYDAQDTYDAPGETYCGWISKWPSIEQAERAGLMEGDALAIPFKWESESEQLAIVTKERNALLAEIRATLGDLEEWDGTPDAMEIIKENLRIVARRIEAPAAQTDIGAGATS